MARNGTEALVYVMPDCDIHKYEMNSKREAVYDAKTKRGPWAFMCQSCFDDNAMYPDLGMGKGQRLILKTT